MTSKQIESVEISHAPKPLLRSVMVLNVSEIAPKVTRIVTLSGGRRGGPGKTALSLFKNVTIRLGRVKGKSIRVLGP